MVVGLAASSLLVCDKAGLLEAYKPKGADALKPQFRPVKDPYTWTGIDAYLGVAAPGLIRHQSMGEQEGWKFMDGLHDNIAAYLHSDSAPCVQAARGERVAGLALDMRGASEKTKGAPIEVVVPRRVWTGRSRPRRS